MEDRIRTRWSVYAKPVVERGPGQAQQHFKDECNINHILAKYRKTGVIEHVTRAREMYGDFSQFSSAAENMDKVAKAQQMFDMLPAELRNRFDNSMKGFLQFIDDPKNLEQCQQWGIYDKPAPPAPPVPSPEPQPEPVAPSKSKPKKEPAE